MYAIEKIIHYSIICNVVAYIRFLKKIKPCFNNYKMCEGTVHRIVQYIELMNRYNNNLKLVNVASLP